MTRTYGHGPTAVTALDRVLVAIPAGRFSVVFLADGRIVDQLADPTAERVLDRSKALGG